MLEHTLVMFAHLIFALEQKIQDELQTMHAFDIRELHYSRHAQIHMLRRILSDPSIWCANLKLMCAICVCI